MFEGHSSIQAPQVVQESISLSLKRFLAQMLAELSPFSIVSVRRSRVLVTIVFGFKGLSAALAGQTSSHLPHSMQLSRSNLFLR